MLNATLAVLTLVIALLLRAEPLRRLRPLTLPLILTSLASFAAFVAQTLVHDNILIRWTSVALILALAFLIARGMLMVIFDLVLVRRMRVKPPRLMREVVALLVYLGLGAIIFIVKTLGKEGELAVCGAQETVMRVFKVTRGDKVFKILETAEEAVQALSDAWPEKQ